MLLHSYSNLQQLTQSESIHEPPKVSYDENFAVYSVQYFGDTFPASTI